MTLPCFTGSVRVKQELVTQIKPEPRDSDAMHFRSEIYDAPYSEIGRSGESQASFSYRVVDAHQQLEMRRCRMSNRINHWHLLPGLPKHFGTSGFAINQTSKSVVTLVCIDGPL